MTMEALALGIDFAAGTDLGCKRSNNEDSYGYDLRRQIYAVCDGMGGMAAGEVASAAAVRELIHCFDAESSAERPAMVEERLLRAIHAANASVREVAASSDRLEGMGTTLVCACLEETKVVIGNVGDSRAYFFRDGQCFQITRDHSFVAEQLSQGLMTPEMAAASDMQSVITRAIGVAHTVEPDLFTSHVQPGDAMLLASDGLTRYVNDAEIGALLGCGQASQAICQALIQVAKERGGADNITCMVLRFVTRTVAVEEAAPAA